MMEFGLVPINQKNQKEEKEESSKLEEKQKMRVVPTQYSHKSLALSLLVCYLIVCVLNGPIVSFVFYVYCSFLSPKTTEGSYHPHFMRDS